jgi:ABC-type transport system involved in multi-copper enzyme maturation permease subunit
MISRVARLVRAETIKLLSNPFFFISMAILLTVPLGAILVEVKLLGQKETVWRSLNSIQLFSYGFRWGIYAATLILLVFSSMMFAGEFDRGTIKNLLTRPVTRTDFFLAKSATVVALGTFFFGVVLYFSLFYSFLFGELGPVWDSGQYLVQREYRVIAAFARKAVLMSYLPLIAAGFLGMLVSNWTESSGYAVAIALNLYILGNMVAGWLSASAQQNVFSFYGAYALDKLRLYAEGGTEFWDKRIEEGLLYLKVPFSYIAAFIPPAFLIFRSRDIHA